MVEEHTMNLPLWVLGEALMDGVVQPDGQLKLYPGGSPFNLACAAALQGVNVTYLNPLSTDAFGQTLADRLTQAGVMQTAERSAKPTSLAIIHMRQGQPSYGFYRDGVADRDYAADDLVRRMKAQTPGVLHTGSLMAMPPELPGAIRASVSSSERGPRSGSSRTVEMTPVVTVIDLPSLSVTDGYGKSALARMP